LVLKVVESPMTSAGIRGHYVRDAIQTKDCPMVIVAGYLVVEPSQRENYLMECGDVRQARRTTGCLDYAISADLLDPSRIGIFERWDSQAAVEAFRGTGPSDGQQAVVVSASVSEYVVNGQRQLT
jgi:quinol monooxygenase YgiN